MPKLRELRLYANRMSGSIPTEIGLASNLESLRLETNFFTGSIPTEIGLATKLTDINFGFNDFFGKIPSEIGTLRNLINIRFNNNALSGRLPSEIGRVDALEVFYATDNLMFGSIPSYYGLLWNMRDLRLSGSGVGGFLPTELALLSNLERLDIADNNFHGTLMTEMGLLTNLCKSIHQPHDCTMIIICDILERIVLICSLFGFEIKIKIDTLALFLTIFSVIVYFYQKSFSIGFYSQTESERLRLCRSPPLRVGLLVEHDSIANEKQSIYRNDSSPIWSFGRTRTMDSGRKPIDGRNSPRGLRLADGKAGPVRRRLL